LLQTDPCPLDLRGRDRRHLDPLEPFRSLPPLNFGRWHTTGDSLADFTQMLSGDQRMPETTRFNLQGFLRTLVAIVVGPGVRVSSRRTAGDQVVFQGEPATERSPS
jgi:hypothetical protein